MKEVFACFDKDSSGAVTTAELALVLKSMNKSYTEADLKKIIGKFDVNGQAQTMQSKGRGRASKRWLLCAAKLLGGDLQWITYN